MEEETYTPAEAAKILRYTERHVRKLLQDGDLIGERDESGRWRVFQRSVHQMLPDRPPRVERSQEAQEEASERAREIKDLYDRIANLQHDLGRAQARAELTELTESTIREERDRLIELTERERRERLEAQEEAQRLREELEAERARGFWRRLFGG